MKAAVYEWYNELRMIWGLEKIGFEDETDPQLLQEDFIFQIEKHDALNRELLQNFIRKTEETSDDGDKIISFDDFDEKAALEAGRLLGYASFFNADVCAAAGRQYGTAQNHAAYITAYNENGLCGLCSVIAFPFNESFCIPFLRVLPEYRGLGLGKALLQRACVYSAPLAATLLFADFCTPSHFITELERNGFKRMGLLYVKDLSIEE